MGPNISTNGQPKRLKQSPYFGTGHSPRETSNMLNSQEGSNSNSFLRGPSPEGFGRSPDGKNGESQERTWQQLSRQQQRIYLKWQKAFQGQRAAKEKQKEQSRVVVPADSVGDSAKRIGESGEGTTTEAVKQQQESIWSGLQKRLAFRSPQDKNAGDATECGEPAIEISLIIQISDQETVRVPLDLTEHESLSTFTSSWLQDTVFKVVKEKRLNTRSASHSKSSTDVPGSEDGLSQAQQLQQRLENTLQPVCLSTVYNDAECVDFLLTQRHEMVATYLPMDSVLKVNYVAKEELEEEKNSKTVPSLRNFDFIKVLGTGGFATVYMVRKRTTGMLYAMKMVKKDGVKQDRVRFAQVYTERQILEQLKNPFLVQLHYAFVTTNYYCLVIDLCTGGELFYYLQKHQSFQLANTKHLFAEVVLAIEFLHQHDILYRDLKPENILVDERGHLRLTDFGLCRGSFKRGRDRAMSFVGSPEYMSPEILLGSGYDYSVDYYTMGVLLYEMLVGLPPHYNEDKMQMYKDITMKEPVIPSVLQGSARDILERLLKISPAERLGMGTDGIQEIKEHPFFREIDWEAIQAKGQQPGRKRLPLEVNILESNFDKQYTRLPIQIDVAQEELIKINEPIELRPSTRIRSHSITFKPQLRQRKQTRQQSMLKKQKLHGQTIIGSCNAQYGDRQKNSTARLLVKQMTQKTRSMHVKRSARDGIPPPAFILNKAGSHNSNALDEQKRTLNRQTNSNQIIAPEISYGDGAIEPRQQLLQRRTDPFQLGGASTLELLSSVQESGLDNKHSQSLLDVFTELSAVDERNPNKEAANILKQRQAYILTTPQENNSLRFSNPQGQAYYKALSPFTPMERGTKAGQVPKLQHGFSEYNKRGPNERGRKNNQETAFNYRKQTLGEDEIEMEQVDLNSQTEFNQMTGSADAEMVLISATPFHQNMMSSPTGVANESIQPFDRTPKNFLAQTYVQGYLQAQSQVNMVELGESVPSVDASAVRKNLERVTGEQVLEEEVDEYMVKGFPTTATMAGQPLKSQQNNNIRVSQFPASGNSQTHSPTEMTYLVSNLGSSANKVQESEHMTPEIKIQPVTPMILLSAEMSKENSKVSFHAYSSFKGQIEDGRQDYLKVELQPAQRLLSESFGTDSSSVVSVEGKETTSLESLFIDSLDESNDMSISEQKQRSLIDQQKIEVMHKIKSKKLKKRLSENNGEHNSFIDCRTPKGDTSHQVLHYEYGYSVEQQRDKVEQVITLNRVLFNSGMRGVSKHQSSQNISNLIAKSVRGMTPRVISKVASTERLPDLPESRPPFEQQSKNKKAFQQDTQRLLTFTEKAAGVVSERNRKFQKPQTLKNLQQKLLQADDDDFIDIDYEEVEAGGTSPDRMTAHLTSNIASFLVPGAAIKQHEVAGDLQLQYNSELISINEFESRGEEDPKQSSTLCADIDDVSSGEEEQKSPILQFQSQSMADITSPRGKKTRKVHQEVQQVGIRESMSSPDIMKNECSSAKRYIEEYLVMSSRNQELSQPANSHHAAHRSYKSKKSGGSKSPSSQTKMRMFNTHAKSNLPSKNPATSLANNTSQDNLLCSPLRQSFTHKKQSGKDLGLGGLPVSSIRMAGGALTSHNMSLHLHLHSDFHSSSKKASMVVTSSPYTSVKPKAKKKGDRPDKSRLGGAVSKKTNSTLSHINKQSAIGNVSCLDSGSKKSSNLKDSSNLAGSSQKTASIMSIGGKRGSLTLHTTAYPTTNMKSTNNFSHSSAGKTPQGNCSTKIQSLNPPRQPSLITSPIQQIDSGDKLSLSLRVLQTPASQSRPSVGPSKDSQPHSGLDINTFVSPKNSRSLRQKYGGSSALTLGMPSTKTKNVSLQSKVLTRSSVKNIDNRLATVSSRRSFHSQGKSSRKQNQLSRSSFVLQNGTTDEAPIPVFCQHETTPEEDKEAYDQWKEAPMLSIAKARTSVQQLPRSNSAIHRMATLPPSGRQNQKKNSQIHPSIFNLVEGIMKPIIKANFEIGVPYGSSKSPEVTLRKSEMSGSQRFGLLLYDSPRGQPFSNQSAQKKAIGKKSLTTTNLGQLIKKHNVVVAQTSSLQKTTHNANEGTIMPNKKDYNLQLLPKEPQDISNVLQTGPEELDSEDCINFGPNEVQYQNGLKKSDMLGSASNLMDSQWQINQIDSSSHALKMHKQKTPFKTRLLQQQRQGVLNETSVEVLKLDGSEFTFSDRERTQSNLLSLKSEEYIGGDAHSQRQLQRGLNSTYQHASPSRAQLHYLVGMQPKQGAVLSADDCQAVDQYSGATEGQQYDNGHQAKTSISKEQPMSMSSPESESIPSGLISQRYQHQADQNGLLGSDDAGLPSHNLYEKDSQFGQFDDQVQRLESELVVQTSDCLLSANSLASLGKTEEAGLALGRGKEESKQFLVQTNNNRMPIAKHPRQAVPKSGSFVSIIPTQKLLGKPSKKTGGKKSNQAQTTKNMAIKKSKKPVKKNPSMVITSQKLTKELTGGKSQLQGSSKTKPCNNSLKLKGLVMDDFYCATEQQVALRQKDLQSRHRQIVSIRNGSLSSHLDDQEDDLKERHCAESHQIIGNLSLQEESLNPIGGEQDRTVTQSDRWGQSTFGKFSISHTQMSLKMQDSPHSNSKKGYIRLASGKKSVGNSSSKTAPRKSSEKIIKAAQKPRSPLSKLGMPSAMVFPKKVSVMLTGGLPSDLPPNKSRSVPKMGLINRAQTTTPITTRNSDRCFTLKDLNSSSSLKAAKMAATATMPSEQLIDLSQELQLANQLEICSPQSKISLKLCLTGPLTAHNKPKSQQRSQKTISNSMKLSQL